MQEYEVVHKLYFQWLSLTCFAPCSHLYLNEFSERGTALGVVLVLQVISVGIAAPLRFKTF